MNNNDNFIIGTTGNVGIGTTVPGQELEVVGDAFVTSKLYIGSDVSDSPWGLTTGDGMIRGAYGANTNFTVANDYAGGYANIYLNKIDSGADIANSNNRVLAFYVDGVQQSSLGVNSAGDLGITMNNNDNFIIGTTGNVGIGTTNPARKLSVYDSTSPVIQVVNSTTGATISDGGYMSMNSSDLFLGNQESGGLLKLFVDNDASKGIVIDGGNVGIGITNPAKKLDVDGGGIVSE
jgi:hypothetical protein